MAVSQNQTRVTEPLSNELANICHLYVRRKRALFFGSHNNSSGVLIHKQYVLTAAHNVYSTWGSKVKSIAVSVGKTTADGNGTLRGVSWRVASGYGWRNFARDFAVVKLEQPMPSAQPFDLATVGSAGDVSRPVHLAGYPGASGGERNGKNLFTGSGTVAFTPGSDMLDYDIDTETGNSGGPVWIRNEDCQPMVVGVHVTELNGTHSRARIADAAFVEEVERMIDSLR